MVSDGSTCSPTHWPSEIACVPDDAEPVSASDESATNENGALLYQVAVRGLGGAAFEGDDDVAADGAPLGCRVCAMGAGRGAAPYVAWGRKTCPTSEARLLYAGEAAARAHDASGGKGRQPDIIPNFWCDGGACLTQRNEWFRERVL